MNCDVYLRKGTVYIPTMGMMQKGFYRGIEPVAVVSISNSEQLRQALQAAIARGNPPVPMLTRRDWPPPVLLKYANVKSWSAFERGMQFWTIEQRDDTFRIASQTKRPDKMWRDDPERIITFSPATTTDNVIERMIAILQEATRNNASSVAMGRPGGQARHPHPLPPGTDDWVRLPSGSERIDELADFIEWMANAKSEDEQVIRAEIKRYFRDAGDAHGAAVLNTAFTALLRPGLTKEARQCILDRLDVFTRTDPRDRRDRTTDSTNWPD